MRFDLMAGILEGPMKNSRVYSELARFRTIEDRYAYLRLGGIVGQRCLEVDRVLGQAFYTSREWSRIRNEVIIRDDGCDIGIRDFPIGGTIFVHHMNPITMEDVVNRNPAIFDPLYLICVSKRTHDAIHYGDASLLPQRMVERRPGDTCPWK